MLRIKFFFGIILAVLTYFVITSSAFNSDSSISNDLHKNAETIKLDSKEIALYNSKKKELQRAIDAYFSEQLKQNLIIGAGVTIVKSDSIVVTSGYGKRDAANNKNVNSETVFRLGSLSKGFTGVLVANLIEEGKLKWKDRVVDYIPEFKFGTKNNLKITFLNP